MPKKVSVIIPTFNHAHLISKCLDSLIAQDYPDWEAIVVNNFSKDNTIEVVESYKDDRIKLINFDNKGIIAAARNEGIRNATGEYIAFLDSDDYWYPNKLSYCLGRIGDNDVVYHNLRVFGPSGNSWKVNKGRKIKKPAFEDLLILGNQIQNSSAIVKKEIIDQLGGLSEDPMLFALEDFDLWIRISQISEKFIFINKTLGGYWVDDNNASRPNPKSIERIQYLYEMYLSELTDSSQKSAKALRNYIAFREKLKLGQKVGLLKTLENIQFLKRRRFIINAIFLLPFCALRSRSDHKT